jgi:hypothetical protein
VDFCCSELERDRSFFQNCPLKFFYDFYFVHASLDIRATKLFIFYEKGLRLMHKPKPAEIGICGHIKELVCEVIINSNPVGAALLFNELRLCLTKFDNLIEGGFVRV